MPLSTFWLDDKGELSQDIIETVLKLFYNIQDHRNAASTALAREAHRLEKGFGYHWYRKGGVQGMSTDGPGDAICREV